MMIFIQVIFEIIDLYNRLNLTLIYILNYI